MGKPLDGIRVFDITLAGVGPWATKLLGELGADVIHVESPDRGAANFIESPQLLYVTANNNKRSALLDLKDMKQREAVYALQYVDGEHPTFFRLGEHERALRLTRLCAECAGMLKPPSTVLPPLEAK